ncbi:hypothetical protein [Parabacteroides gordonii]|uniref:hypothetical protein n=1 Tax=Parabacteroides gordonii TaxID=574930 RepID=UPI0003FDE7C0|nr:hypothetical protein [Parabacteroides gordonii]MCA5585232.1 hypothetical protein [Parabacteroides gordonii]RGP16253.1 hypothetical protein DXB27_12130 [Parabacteroides gordonii]
MVEFTSQLIPTACRVNRNYLPGSSNYLPAGRNYLPGNCRQDRGNSRKVRVQAVERVEFIPDARFFEKRVLQIE